MRRMSNWLWPRSEAKSMTKVEFSFLNELTDTCPIAWLVNGGPLG